MNVDYFRIKEGLSESGEKATFVNVIFKLNRF